MSEYTSYDEEKARAKKKKKVRISPKSIFGIFCGTFFLFIISFLLSYMLMNHNPSMPGTNSLQEENEELKAKIEELEERLEKYEDVDDFADVDVPDEYTGATITAGGSEPHSDKNESNNEEKTTNSMNNNSVEADDDSSINENESAYHGIIIDEDIPANTGISDAPVEVH